MCVCVCVCVVGAGVLEEDAASVHAGKDFALMRTHSGKVSLIVCDTVSLLSMSVSIIDLYIAESRGI